MLLFTEMQVKPEKSTYPLVMIYPFVMTVSRDVGPTEYKLYQFNKTDHHFSFFFDIRVKCLTHYFGYNSYKRFDKWGMV